MPTPPIGADCTGAAPRQEVRELTDEQWQHFIAAIRTLQARATPETASAYDQLAFIHHKYANAGRIHQTASFLPWHRLFLRAFEYELQQIDPTVTVPYWDWTRDSTRLANAPFWRASLLGGNGTGGRGVVHDGGFADWVPFRGPVDGVDKRNYGLVRFWGNDEGLEAGAAAPTIERVLRRSKTFDALREGIETGGHGDVHIAVGGDMADFYSPNDPVFWLHHAFIDKLWADWQARPGNDPLDYGGPTIKGPDRAKLTDALDGFSGVTVADVMQSSALCASYAPSTTPLETVTTLRASSATIRPREKVVYIATVSSAEKGTVDFDQTRGNGLPDRPLCTNVQPVFAVDTWTAVCETDARKLSPGVGSKSVVATYRGGAGEKASSGLVRQRVARNNPKVLWNPAETVTYGTPLGENLTTFENVPGTKRFTVLATAAKPRLESLAGVPLATRAPETTVGPDTILDAGYHVLLLRFKPTKGPAQLLTRRFIVTPGTLFITPQNQRITTEEKTPPLSFDIFGFVASETPASLTGFEQPICRAASPEGLAEGAPRPVGEYTIFCEGGSSLNYVFETGTTGTLEVLSPDDPNAGLPPDQNPLPTGDGGGPSRLQEPKVCTSFESKVYCGGIGRRASLKRFLLLRKGRIVARGRARKQGDLLEVRANVRPGRYVLLLLTRSGKRRQIPIRILPPTPAGQASAGVRFGRRSRLCRLGTMRLLGARTRDGVRATRWRIVQR